MKTIGLNLKERGYNIYITQGGLSRAADLLKLDRKTLIVTDSGVPEEYARQIEAQCAKPLTLRLPAGESTKSMENLALLCKAMLEHDFSRKDCVIAVGGGVIGDLAGFAASVYMRGIDFYNIPTTLLSQLDSSIGGKTAVNFCGVKNIIGSFHQPKAVLIDTQTLKTLPDRHFSNGLAEAVKMAATFDREFFAFFENSSLEQIKARPEYIIGASLIIKRNVVELDEKESGIRRALNFGHTIGHGIESSAGLNEALLHGECVALGMLPLSSAEVRESLIKIYRKIGLPTEVKSETEKIFAAMAHDKKHDGDLIAAVLCEKAGSYKNEKLSSEQLRQRFETAFGRR